MPGANGLLKGRKGLAATLMTSLVAAVLLIPVIFLGSSLAEQVALASGWVRPLLSEGPPDPPGWIAEIPVVGPQLYEYWQGLAHNTAKLLNEIASAKLISELSDYLFSAGEFLLIGAAAIGKGTLQLALSLFVAFFFYRDGMDGAKRLQSVTRRLWGDRGLHVLDVVGATIKSVVYGTIGTAVAQSTFNYFGPVAGRRAGSFAAWIRDFPRGSYSHRRAVGVDPGSALVILYRGYRMGDFFGALGIFRRRRRGQYNPALFYQPGQRPAFCPGFPRGAGRDPCLWFSRSILGSDVACHGLRNRSGLGAGR